MRQQQGHIAEQEVAKRLQRKGFKILLLNARQTSYEIDIAAIHNGVLHVFEVKYRRESSQGEGEQYVDGIKRKQLVKAAQQFAQDINYQGDIELQVVAIGGPDMSEVVFFDQLFWDE